MKVRDPDSMNVLIGEVLRYGVLLSASIIVLGTIGLIATQGSADASALLQYPGSVSVNVPASPGALFSGLESFSPLPWIELGVMILMATPLSRVAISVFLFGAERDKLYVVITAVVLSLLLFSMFVTPFIPLFHG